MSAIKTSPIDVVDKKRRCGWRKEGGVYIMGGMDVTKDGASAIFTLINPPIPYQVKVHRGPRIVNSAAVLWRRPMEEWWFGASKDHEEKKNADAWALSMFGMTQRLKIGECAGLKGTDKALAHIASKIVWNPTVIKYYRELTLLGVGNLPRAAEPYDTLRSHIALIETNQKLDNLLGIQAAIWRLADSIPPSARKQTIPVLTKMLALLNLPLDAIAMREKYI